MGDWRKQLSDFKKVMQGKQPERKPMPGQAAATGSEKGPEETKPLPQRDLCIGLDFGTSSTKSVVRLLPSGPAYVVEFSKGGDEVEPYLMPTRLWVATDGTLALQEKGGGGWIQELKVTLMEQPWIKGPVSPGSKVVARPVDLAAGYIALVLRSLQRWCDEQVLPALGAVKPRWSLNLGIPARDLGANEIREAFGIAAKAGWHMAVSGGQIDIVGMGQAVDQAKAPTFVPSGMEAEMIQVVPEVAAGVTTYARSSAKRAGPHLFVDVGATTLDSSMFLLDDHDGLKYVFLAADVDSSLGALRLHKHRAHELGRLALERFSAANPLKPIPPTARDCLPEDGELEQIDSQFTLKCAKKLGSVIYNTKMKDPKGISVDDSDPSACIRVMLSGGGVGLPLYQETVRLSGERAAPNGGQGLRVRPFSIEPIPKPTDFQSPELPQNAWERLAVAYGLSYRYEDIGEFVPPSEVTRMPLPQVSTDDDSYVSKDQV
ncbi:MAG: hypothetical protein KF766_13250 [Rhodocyclaceae bacterium]|nr:hypothetical protein [Rhodocyclaceae bacterium]